MILIYLLILTNLARKKPLILSPTLSRDAAARAEYFCNHELSHEGWLKFIPETSDYVGENLAYGFSDAVTLQQAFLNSPSHKENIVDPKYKYIGIANKCGVTVEYFASDFIK